MVSDTERKGSDFVTRIASSGGPAQLSCPEMNLGGSVRINPTGVALLAG